ncbi:SDR family NAD(P)-dependent oxidoreductase [Sphingopyxis sp. GW247-27LB]|uniref:SDR family NAD(P)-dependent oxidoreductase n=1 Tax=Sphingopyxis sp. GW247-27LB TaxID=2012632 RepID=UPI000BA531B2|nr:glucose 1-dehydrogenase [Sphingopyxis sp. GW247-27LB]PAL24182.1 short-chain dehydrogenase [Sphingopyxis sp. GW247-27LB]
MAKRLLGKVAVITGGASGMGQASVHMYLREGAKVVIADLNPQTGQETLDKAKADGFGDAVRFIRVDVSQEDQVKAMIDLAMADFGRLDVVFNNAGVGGAMGMITETTLEEWDRSFAILLRSVFLGTKYGALAMRETGGGSIINTASTAGLAGGSGPAAYSAAKAGVINLCKNAAIQLAADRIRVNAIAPGGIQTPLIATVKTEDDMKTFMKGKQPWPDTGKPDDIAYAAVYLGSDESRFVTGTTLLVDGGLLAWGPGLFPHADASATTGFRMSSTGEADKA